MRLPKPWVLVLLGLLLNIVAMLISSTKIEQLDSAISALNDINDENSYAIQRAWSSVDTLERKKENLVLYMSTMPTLNQQTASLVSSQLSPWLIEPPETLSNSNVQLWFDAIDHAQSRHRNDIDQYYLQTLEINEQVTQQQITVSWFKQIALFLQVFGLALILARDLSK
ncbi:DNA mismatch repair protein [Vibrio ulleungensis]|uniref:DNA mismatch repair protein n=1 Tax=Vibrio ulleungensis TaxID=2807619 RepID=A0ABS2HCT0_9VIBR|nr:DNA mismatch repair protein [Vibrio ulleungensis]MBM7034871.1 DNA mismatch repair protein [Vibrio ulleungensis]